MTRSSTIPAPAPGTADATEIRQFRVDIPQADLDDLRRRLTATRWPVQTAGGWERGVPVDYLRGLAQYWAGGYDWRAAEAKLNAVPQFTTAIDGRQVHFLHVRSADPDAMPLLMVHGWPGSPVDFTRVLDLLATDFHLVVPSLPGFGFSAPGGGLAEAAAAFGELMDRLGYDRYVAQGGDAGAGVIGALSRLHPDRVVALHVNGPSPMPFGPPLDPDNFTGRDRDRAQRFNEFRERGLGYLQLQSTRPHTAGYGLADSPVAQLAWIVEKYREWTDPAAELPEDAIDRDHILTNASVHWFTGTGATSAQFLYESMNSGGAWGGPTAPTGFAVFAGDMGIRALYDPDGALPHWTEYDRGGHFPAMEVPELFAEDVRTWLRTFR
jgi:pimeloyl-ACP methyl ester carboxylesterase